MDQSLQPSERNAALAAIERDTRWHTWVGVAGLLYAAKPRSSPPRVVRAATPEQLREAIAASEQQRRQR